MAALDKYREVRVFENENRRVQIVYDFAVDAGAVGALDVCKAKEAMVVEKAYFKVKTTATSGGAATVSLGISGDAAGLVAATAVASLTAGAVIDGVAFGSGYKLAADDVVQLAIAVAALTAGKIEVVLEMSQF